MDLRSIFGHNDDFYLEISAENRSFQLQISIFRQNFDHNIRNFTQIHQKYDIKNDILGKGTVHCMLILKIARLYEAFRAILSVR